MLLEYTNGLIPPGTEGGVVSRRRDPFVRPSDQRYTGRLYLLDSHLSSYGLPVERATIAGPPTLEDKDETCLQSRGSRSRR